ncbi:AbiV family abortive infection protein [Nocardia salmonicida]|uniref:AbiV family abortive infection protein n=1 Tax=Nocardia salmonicida TaxID=53431 RepID=UPI00379ED302
MAMELNVQQSRLYWRTLMANVTGLITDAHLLLRCGSAGRARALTILAQEELARANAVYELAHATWTAGQGVITLPSKHLSSSVIHADKITATDAYGRGLEPFWGEYEDILPLKSVEEIKKTNNDKKNGFYVDSKLSQQGTFDSPLDADPDVAASGLRRAAKVAEMALIRDNTRMQDSTQPHDSTSPLQTALLPISHPELFAADDSLFDQN